MTTSRTDEVMRLAVPSGVLYDGEHRDFYLASDMSSMGKEFRREWIEFAHLFPQITAKDEYA